METMTVVFLTGVEDGACQLVVVSWLSKPQVLLVCTDSFDGNGMTLSVVGTTIGVVLDSCGFDVGTVALSVVEHAAV